MLELLNISGFLFYFMMCQIFVGELSACRCKLHADPQQSEMETVDGVSISKNFRFFIHLITKQLSTSFLSSLLKEHGHFNSKI